MTIAPALPSTPPPKFHTLKQAAETYVDDFSGLLTWVADTLWASPKPGSPQEAQKSRLRAIRGVAEHCSTGHITSLDPADYADAVDVFNSASYDAVRFRGSPLPIPSAYKNIEQWIHAARDGFVQDLVNGKYIAQGNPGVKINALRIKARDFMGKYNGAMVDLETALIGNHSTILEETFSRLRTGLDKLSGKKTGVITKEEKAALDEGKELLEGMVAMARYRSPVADSLKADTARLLDEASKEFATVITPLIDEVSAMAGGLVGQFSGQTRNGGKP